MHKSPFLNSALLPNPSEMPSRQAGHHVGYPDDYEFMQPELIDELEAIVWPHLTTEYFNKPGSRRVQPKHSRLTAKPAEGSNPNQYR